jgi:hypothetical protein
MSTKLLSALCFIGVLGCTQQPDQVAELEKEVLSIHDEVMPKMDDIMELKRELKYKMTALDSLQQEGMSSSNLAEERMRASDLNRQLVVADSLMMEWMYHYRGDSAKALPKEQALQYFGAEKEKINDVKSRTLKSIEEAKGFLQPKP